MKDAVLQVTPGSRLLAWWRLLHPVPSLITVLAAGAFVLLAQRGIPPLGRLAHLLAVEACMQFSISAFNDYFDRHTDTGRHDKPVASGLVSPHAARSVGAVLGVACLLLALPLGPWFILLTATGLAGGLLYDAGLKSTAFSWLPFSLAFPTLPLWAWAGVYPDNGIPGRLLWVVPVGAVLVLAIHMADTVPDIASDAEAGVRGLAHRIGLRRSLALCWGAFAAASCLTIALWSLLDYNAQWYLPGLLAGLALVAAGIALYLVMPARVRQMALLVELGSLALAIGWIGGMML